VENSESNEEDEAVSEQVAVPTEKEMEDDDENPFKIKQHPFYQFPVSGDT
jgi:hypothetical protein